MVELLPTRWRGEEAYIGSYADFTLLERRVGRCWYIWCADRALPLTRLTRGDTLKLGDIVIDLEHWVGGIVKTDWRFLDDEDEYVELIAPRLAEGLRGKRVLLSYSGGKDSTAALIILLKLAEIIGFDLRVAYIHMPYLEPERNIRFVEEVARRLGIEIEILEPDRPVVLRYLLTEGLPYRRARWCTYLKVRMLRLARKRAGADVVAIGDRAWEAAKRERRLARKVRELRLLEGRKLYIIAPLTIADVIGIVRRHGLVHPDYMDGHVRVSCLYCPYKAAFELKIKGAEVEDPGLIERVMRNEWRRWYRDRGIPLEDFIERDLWRYTPSVAALMLHLQREAEREGETEGEVRLDELREAYAAPWREGLGLRKRRLEEFVGAGPVAEAPAT